MKTLYGVGLGPGDPELLTIKAQRLIKESDYVFIPSSKGESLAATIAKSYISHKNIIELEFTMGENNSTRYKEAAKKIVATLKENQNGVFLTLGDPLIYSTFIYLMKELSKLGIKTFTVPGITSFTSAASLLGRPLTLKDESFYLCDGDIDEEILKRVDSVAILKVTRRLEEIIGKLENHGFKYAYIKRCTQENQRVLFNKEDILLDRDYMSLIIGRRR